MSPKKRLIALVNQKARKPSLARKLKNRRYGVAYLIRPTTLEVRFLAPSSPKPAPLY